MLTKAVLGVGSPFAADTLGWQVIDRLRKDYARQLDEVFLEKLDRPGALLIENFQGRDHVIIVDAVLAKPAGQVVCWPAEKVMAADSPVSSHQLGVAGSLALASALHQLPTQCHVCGVTVDDPEQWHFSEQKLRQLAEMIVAELS